jgi:hypothetical protein
MNFKKIILGILLIFIYSCKKSENKTDRIFTENYSIEAPNDFERTNEMNELAKVQFRKANEDLRFIVLEEPKEGFKNAIKLGIHKTSPSLLGYYKVITMHFDEITENFKINDFSNTKINSCNAIVFSMSGKDLEDGKSVFYRYAIFEDNKNLYQIMSWTNIHYKDKLIGRMESIINSFKSNSISK